MTNVVTPKLLEQALAAMEARLEAKFVTPKLLEQALAAMEARLEAKFVTPKVLEKALAAMEARTDDKLGALEAKIDAKSDAKFEAQFVRLNLAMAQLRIDINADTLRNIQSVEESYRTRTAAVDDRYRDLPERVTALEHAVGIKRA